MSLKQRMIGLRVRSPLMTVANLVEITMHGDMQDREGDFLQAATQVLRVTQQEVEEAVAFTKEPPTGLESSQWKMFEVYNEEKGE